jgi:S1-C subfamily serine protease
MSSVLKAVSEALVETVRAAEAGVVRVEARSRLPSSGVILSAAEGLVVTSSHGLEREREIRVGLAGGHTLPARLVGRDAGTDLAVLRLEASGLPQPAWAEAAGEPSPLQVGSLVLALGRPGPSVLATFGIISATEDGWRTPNGGFVETFVQTDAVMYPGFSGGALVSVEAQVLGMVSSGLVPGLSVALPTATVRRVVGRLVAHKPVRAAYLGVTTQPVRLPAALGHELGQAEGLLLTHVEPGSPAEHGQLVQGDTLVTLNGQPLRSLNDLLRLLHTGAAAGEPAGLRLVRAGEVRQATVTLGDRP